MSIRLGVLPQDFDPSIDPIGVHFSRLFFSFFFLYDTSVVVFYFFSSGSQNLYLIYNLNIRALHRKCGILSIFRQIHISNAYIFRLSISHKVLCFSYYIEIWKIYECFLVLIFMIRNRLFQISCTIADSSNAIFHFSLLVYH